MKREILKMLREAEGYISGQQICEQFGVSRTAVWKVIRQLQDEGYVIEAVRNKGYQIMEYPDVITGEEVECILNTEWAGKNIVYYKETDSTNLRARQLGDQGAPHGTLVLTDRQTAGRGRRGRVWESPGGSNIYMSILLRPDIAPDRAPMLTLVMACSIVEGINRCMQGKDGLDIKIKWPNDIIVNGKKLVGMLTEMNTEIEYINHVTVGVGINVNVPRFPESLQETATSLYMECGHAVKRAPIIAAAMESLERNYRIFMETQDMTGLMEKYSKYLVNRNKEVMILGAKEQYKAFALGINRAGELIVRKEDGTEDTVYAGEVSVRGVYGYV